MAEELEINEEQRSYLLTNAETLVFVDGRETVDKYKCLNCDNVAIKHLMTNCKHVFCWKCIKEVFSKPCPCCNVEIAEVMKDAQIEKGLLELKVECLYKKHGCQEIVPLYKCQEHTETCQMSTKDLLPKLYGGHSQSEMLKELIDDLHKMRSDIKEIREEQLNIASQNFEKLKTVQEVMEKLKTIQVDYDKLKIIQDDYENLKTKHHDSEQMIHRLQKEMEDRKEFEKKTSDNIGGNKERVSEIKLEDDEQVLKLQGTTSVDPDELVCHGIAFFCTINGVNQKLQNMKTMQNVQQQRQLLQQSILNQNFNYTDLGLQFIVHIKFTEAYITIDLNGFQCNLKFTHSRQFTLIDQSGHADKAHVTFIDAPLFSKNPDFIKKPYFRSNNLAPMSLLENHFETFVKEDSLLIEIRFIPLAIMYKSVASRNGTLLWRIDNYSKKKQEEIEGIRHCLISESFYTAQQGYRAHVRLCLNGDGNVKGKCISIYVEFIKGEFDSSLPIPIVGIAKFFLRDQSGSSNRQHLYKEIAFSHAEGGPHHGIADFVLWSQAEEAKYLKEDTLLFKIMIHIL